MTALIGKIRADLRGALAKLRRDTLQLIDESERRQIGRLEELRSLVIVWGNKNRSA